MAAKELGNAAYKKKKFDEAHLHYDKAIELDPKEMSFLTNKAAVFFEQKVKIKPVFFVHGVYRCFRSTLSESEIESTR